MADVFSPPKTVNFSFQCLYILSKEISQFRSYHVCIICTWASNWDRINLPLSTVVDNVVIATKGLQDRNTNITAGTTVENKGKLILTEIFPSVQKHDI